MEANLTLPCGEGFLNVRSGAVLVRDGRQLLLESDGFPYLYSVGGRIRFGESAEEAVVREVLEETGASLRVERLFCVHECFYRSDTLEVPEGFVPVCESRTEDGDGERPVWVTPEDPRPVFPAFLRTAPFTAGREVLHIVERDLQPPDRF